MQHQDLCSEKKKGKKGRKEGRKEAERGKERNLRNFADINISTKFS